MRGNLDALGGFLLSERVMFALADKLGKQSAHEAVYEAAMRGYAGSRVRGGDVPWLFLTTRSARELMPLVEGFGQDVRYEVDRSSGAVRRELAHVLKVFLIDRAGYIREIYSSTFLHPRTVLNDIETLIGEDRAR